MSQYQPFLIEFCIMVFESFSRRAPIESNIMYRIKRACAPCAQENISRKCLAQDTLHRSEPKSLSYLAFRKAAQDVEIKFDPLLLREVPRLYFINIEAIRQLNHIIKFEINYCMVLGLLATNNDFLVYFRTL